MPEESMKTQEILTTDNDHFCSSLDNGILVVRQKKHILHMTKDLKEIFSLYDYMNSMLASKAYKAFVLFAYSEKSGHTDYGNFLSKVLSGDRESKELARFLNLVNKLILAISTLDRMTVFAGQGMVSLFYLNIGLAHDYRIIAEDTVFENPNADIGLITKGSGYFLPRLLGIRKATEVLQWTSFSAEDALQLGLVDRIVPASKLEQEAMQFAIKDPVRFSSALLGIRKLLKCDTKELERSLELEDDLIRERLSSVEFRKTFAAGHKVG
jgi:2-(1,2-epoxy-1,2-dihydrophenyl)acetyl-CoA isomerase